MRRDIYLTGSIMHSCKTSFLRLAVSIFISFLLLNTGCKPSSSPPVYTPTFFRPFVEWSNQKVDRDIRFIDSRIRDLEDNFGMYRQDFEYSLPADKKLITIFEAEQDGSPVPDLTFTAQITPGDPVENDRAIITVKYIHPSAKIPSYSYPGWFISIHNPGAMGQTRVMKNAMPQPTGVMTRGISSGGTPGVVQDNTDYQIWSYELSEHTQPDNSQSTRFKYNLKIRVEKLEDKDRSNTIKDINR
jgi:hypothetical protein